MMYKAFIRVDQYWRGEFQGFEDSEYGEFVFAVLEGNDPQETAQSVANNQYHRVSGAYESRPHVTRVEVIEDA